MRQSFLLFMLRNAAVSSLETCSVYPSFAKASNQMTDLPVLHTEKHLDNKEGHTLKGIIGCRSKDRQLKKLV